MNIESCIKVDGARSVPPERTVARLESLLGPRFDYFLWEEEVADCLYWTALFLDDEPDFRAMGKGISAVRSKAGALAEAAEWLTARRVNQFPGYFAGHQEDVADAVPIESLLGHIATATPTVVEKIKRLDSAKHWVPGWSLRDHRPMMVPIEYVWQIGGSNGRASGNHLEEAVLHGVCEVFERRALITVLRNRLIIPTIDIDTVNHSTIRAQVEALRSRGVEITLKDFSFGGVLPCVGAYFVDSSIPREYQFRHFLKVGASFDKEEALMRVFTEFTQGRKSSEFLCGSGEDGARIMKPDFRRLASQEYTCDNFLSSFMFGLVPYTDADFLGAGDRIAFDPGVCFPDCCDDIALAIRICEELGKDLIVVDLTDPEVGFPVVQTVVPGYSDVLPFHPAHSSVLFSGWDREDVLWSYRGDLS